VQKNAHSSDLSVSGKFLGERGKEVTAKSLARCFDDIGGRNGISPCPLLSSSRSSPPAWRRLVSLSGLALISIGALEQDPRPREVRTPEGAMPKKYRGVVYFPPDPRRPFVAVVVDLEGEVSATRPFASSADAKAFLDGTLKRIDKRLAQLRGARQNLTGQA
jgi:hypothetical protein